MRPEFNTIAFENTTNERRFVFCWFFVCFAGLLMRSSFVYQLLLLRTGVWRFHRSFRRSVHIGSVDEYDDRVRCIYNIYTIILNVNRHFCSIRNGIRLCRTKVCYCSKWFTYVMTRVLMFWWRREIKIKSFRSKLKSNEFSYEIYTMHNINDILHSFYHTRYSTRYCYFSF